MASSSTSGDLTRLDKLRFSAALAERQVRGRFDAAFFDHLALVRPQLLLPETIRRPYGVFLHGIEAWSPLTSGGKDALCRAKLRVANSSYTAARTSSTHPGVGAIRVCHLALADEVLKGSRSEKAANEGEESLRRIGPNCVLITGRMSATERYKGHAELIRCWPRVLREVPNAQLMIVGTGNGRGEMQELAREAGVSGQVIFTGFVSQPVLNEIYDRVAVFAMPSRSEGFGLVYLEAMYHRLPCIGSIHDAAGEVIADGQTGFLVDQGDLEGMAARIVQLLSDRVMRASFGNAGYERLEQNFSRPRFDARFSTLLGELVQ